MAIFPERQPEDSNSGNNLTSLSSILLVDDDVTFLYSLSEALHIHLPSVSVVTCNSGWGALRQIETRNYDAIISNIKMPLMDGLELLHSLQIRQLQIPTILVTGYEDDEQVVQALRQGAYDIIQKPVDWGRLARNRD